MAYVGTFGGGLQGPRVAPQYHLLKRLLIVRFRGWSLKESWRDEEQELVAICALKHQIAAYPGSLTTGLPW